MAIKIQYSLKNTAPPLHIRLSLMKLMQQD